MPNEKDDTDNHGGHFTLCDACAGAIQHRCFGSRPIQGRGVAGGYGQSGTNTPQATVPVQGATCGTSPRPHRPLKRRKEIWVGRYLSVSYPLQRIRINSSYGYRKDPFTGKRKFHNGIDLHARGDEVLAMMEGVVVKVGQDKTSGKYVTLRHGSYTVSYCHLSKVFVGKGATVRPRDVVGVSGSTGRSTGEHLHITCKLNGKSIDPLLVLDYIKSIQEECVAALAAL